MNKDILDVIEQFNLSKKELDVFNEILIEGLNSEDGASDIMKYIYSIDYEEIPVSIDTFLENEDYLGGIFNKGQNIYPYWRTKLREIFSPNKNLQEVIFSGAIGIGKSMIADISIAYIIYQLLCLRHPARYYGLTDDSRIGIALINVTLDAAFDVGYRKLMGILTKSPWFLRHGRVEGKEGSERFIPMKNIQIIPASNTRHTIGRDIFAAFLDEVSFGIVKDPQAAKKKVLHLYTNIQRRIESRFMVRGKVPGKLFLVSSKNKASDFLESYIDANKHRDDIIIVDEPIWVVKGHKLNLCGDKFSVAVGGRLLPHKILTKDDDPNQLKKLGYRIIQVPIEYRRSFHNNLEVALNDIAGIATEASAKFMVTENVKNVMGTIPNGFTVGLIKIGLKSGFAIQDFFDISKVQDHYGKTIYVHLDLSKSGDKTGIAVVIPRSYTSVDKIDKNSGSSFETLDVQYDVIGAVHLQALEGSEIPYFRIKEFVVWLSNYFTIGFASADGYQSVEMIQYFTLQGWSSKVISVDIKPNAYLNLRSAIDENRIRVPDLPLLRDEFLGLEETETGKIDHPYTESGNPAGSKDLSDAICGACWTIYTSKEVSDVVTQAKEKAVDTLLAALEEQEDDSLFDWI